jgi:hypothetical protein
MNIRIHLVLSIISSSCHTPIAAGLRSLFPNNGNVPVHCGDVKCNPNKVCHAVKGCIDPEECVSTKCSIENLDTASKQCMVAIVDCLAGTCDEEYGCPVQCGDAVCQKDEVCHAIKGCIAPEECVGTMCMFEDLDTANKQCMVAIVDCLSGQCNDETGCVDIEKRL